MKTKNNGAFQRADPKVFDHLQCLLEVVSDLFMNELMFNNYYKAIYLLMSTFTSKYKSTPTFSFKGRQNSITSYNDPSYLPSPHAYNPEKVSLNSSPSAKFPKSIRKQWMQISSKKNLPGPGAHESKSYITQGPKKTISKLLFKHHIPLTPSPNFYNSDVSVLKKKQPSFSIKKRTISMLDLVAGKNLNKPSPAHYEQPIIKFKSTASMTMPKSSRKSFASSEKFPGPGSYQTQKSFSQSKLSDKKCKIAKEARKINFSLGQRSPGPVVYEKKGFVQLNKEKSRGYSCREKILAPEQKNPGPGQYQIPIIKNFHSAPVIKMPKSARVSFTDKNIKIYKNNPGPGSFDLDGIERMKFRSMSVHKFTKQKKSYITETIRNQSSLSLAPGSYNGNSLLIKKSSPKFSIGHSANRQLLCKIPKLPGPSDYDPKLSLIYQSQMNHKMQKSSRGNSIKHLLNIPGPGEYQLPANKRLGRNFKFSKEKRKNYNETKIKQQRSILHQTYEQRQLFPNPPKYMGVVSKLKFNEQKLTKN